VTREHGTKLPLTTDDLVLLDSCEIADAIWATHCAPVESTAVALAITRELSEPRPKTQSSKAYLVPAVAEPNYQRPSSGSAAATP
jgi:hypothetical protein